MLRDQDGNILLSYDAHLLVREILQWRDVARSQGATRGADGPGHAEKMYAEMCASLVDVVAARIEDWEVVGKEEAGKLVEGCFPIWRGEMDGI